MSKIEKEIASRFKCPKCHNTGGNVKSLAMAEQGLLRFLIFNTTDISLLHVTIVDIQR